MKLSHALLPFAFAATALPTLAHAQTGSEASAPSSKAESSRHQDTRPLKTFYLHTGSSANDANEILTSIRVLTDPEVKIFLTPSLNAISVRADDAQLKLIEQILADIDRPKKEYRLTYTLTEMDAGKRVGFQNFAIVVTAGGHTTLKNGSKIPIATGTTKDSGSDANNTTQFTYLDIGINIDASIDDYANGARLRTKVEQSSATEDKTIAGVTEPIIRQSVLEGTSFLAPGQPLALGSFDLPGTTRHIEVTVVMEPAS